MKTLKEIEADIQKEADEIAEARKQKKRKSDSKIISMRLAKNYLEFNPTKESVERQKSEVENYLSIYEYLYQKIPGGKQKKGCYKRNVQQGKRHKYQGIKKME